MKKPGIVGKWGGVSGGFFPWAQSEHYTRIPYILNPVLTRDVILYSVWAR